MNQINNPFITPKYLANHLNDEDIKIIDASWYLPNMARNAHKEYLQKHIPNAVYFNLDKIADRTSNLPHMIASEEQFSRQVGEMGISHKNRIVIYDNVGIFSSARVWWNFRIMGAKNVYILAGGLTRWEEEGFEMQGGNIGIKPNTFEAKLQSEYIYTAFKITKLLKNETNQVQIVDMRPRDRFMGEADEPRIGLRRGHIPYSKNLPFADLIENGEIISKEAFFTRLKEAEINPNKPIVSTCGSGVTATILNLALATHGIDNMAVYDGSWAQWGSLQGVPIVNPANKKA